jgi:hypothetical protein
MAKKKKAGQGNGSAWWHVGIDEFPMNDENMTAYRVAISEFSADKAEQYDWWFADPTEADRAKSVLERHGFTVYGRDHMP